MRLEYKLCPASVWTHCALEVAGHTVLLQILSARSNLTYCDLDVNWNTVPLKLMGILRPECDWGGTLLDLALEPRLTVTKFSGHTL